MKPDLTRLPPRAAAAIARAIESGDEKYSEGDWLAGDSRRHIAGALRHAFEFLEGNDVDECGEHALAMVGARIAIALEIELREPGTWRIHAENFTPPPLEDDIPKWDGRAFCDDPECESRACYVARRRAPALHFDRRGEGSHDR